MILRILITGFIFATVSAYAQIDPSSALLLDPKGTTAGVTESGLDTGRYTARPKAESRKETIRPTELERDRAAQSETPKENLEATPPQKAQIPPPQAPNTAGPVVPPLPPQAPRPPQTPAAVPDLIPKSPSAFEWRDERRMTLLEIGVAPGYLYNNSASDYAFRNYSTSAPVIGLDATVWLNPGFALQTGYLGTLGGHISDSLSGSRTVAAAQQWFNVGFRSRTFFGTTRLSPVLIFGVDYQDYEFRAPSDAQMRAKLKTSGVRLLLETELPASVYRTWTLGVSFSPKQQHKETPTGIDFHSGGSVDSNIVGVSVGSKIRFDRVNSMFWKVNYLVEKDVFSGEATTNDLVTGQKPNGVAVTNSFVFIQLGYVWGN